MPDTSTPEVPDESPRRREQQSVDGYHELRRLLLDPEQQQLRELQVRFDEWHIDAGELSQTLPEAIRRRPQPDPSLTSALSPTVEESIKVSVHRDPTPLVEAISPLMGPAMRRAITQALQSMIQSFNQTLEQSISWRGIQWRLEARRTGKSIGEVALLHTLDYRVEQVFLIHKETGLLLQHVVADTVTAVEPESVSGMMTAILDFVQDAFRGQSNDALDMFHVGDLTVWVEQSPRAFLAAVIRGTPSVDIRSLFQNALATIHREHGNALDAFDGNAAPFRVSQPLLQACLVTQTAEQTRITSPVFWIVAALVVVVLALGFGSRLREYWCWNAYVRQLEDIPGIIVTRAEKQWGSYVISGLHDPLAADPYRLLEASKVPVNKVISLWEPYYALYPAFILQRARQILQPPKTVTLRLHAGTLTATGRAPHAWVAQARNLARVIPGVTHWQDDALVATD